MDTHIVLWFLGDVEKLLEAAFAAIIEPANKKYVSIVSAWELAIKINLGKTFITADKNISVYGVPLVQ